MSPPVISSPDASCDENTSVVVAQHGPSTRAAADRSPRPASLGSLVNIGPLTIKVLDIDHLLQELMAKATGLRQTHHVMTANAQFYNLAEIRQEFRDCAARAEYVCADGISIVMACKWFGATSASRIPGVDLVEEICKRAAIADVPVYFLGGKPGSAAAAARVLAARYPGFKVAGLACPPPEFEKNDELLGGVLESIGAVKPAFLFVAMGAPRQEFFIDQHIRPLGVPVALGIGGSFEIIGGTVRRAPPWVQGAGMEWAYRWMQEPRRLARRYLIGNVQFSCYLVRNFIRRSMQSRVNHGY